MFQKMLWLIGFGVTADEILRVDLSEKLMSVQKIPKSFYFKG